MRFAAIARKKFFAVVPFVVVFAAVGSVLLFKSHAATPTVSIEAESGTVATAGTVSDTTASGGSAVKFQQAASGGSNSCPAYPSFPTASCTGIPAGTTLTTKTGNQTISTDGAVVSGWDVNGKLIINADNVTVKNTKVHGPAAGGCSNGAAIEVNGTNDVVQDTTVVMDHPTACLDGIWLNGNFESLLRVNVGGGTDGVKAGIDPSAHDYTITDSYIHDMKWNANDPNQGNTETHNDGVQTWSGAHNISLIHNRIDLSTTLDSSGQLASNSAWQDGGSNSRADYNYLDGGGCTLNFAAGGQTQSSIFVDFNHFGRNRGFNGCVALISNESTMSTYNGNVYDDTGAAVPTWQQHD